MRFRRRHCDARAAVRSRIKSPRGEPRVHRAGHSGARRSGSCAVVTARSPCSGPKIEQRLADVNEFTGDVCQPPFRVAMKLERSPTSNPNMGGWGEPGEGADPVDGG